MTAITDIYSKVELDLGNYAHRLKYGSIAVEYGDYDISVILPEAESNMLIDGDRTHINGNAGVFISDNDLDGMNMYFNLTLSTAKYINTIHIYGYPGSDNTEVTTLTSDDVVNSCLTNFKIYYSLDGITYNLWTGLVDKNADYGLPATTISGGEVTANTSHINIFQSPTALLIKSIRVTITAVADSDDRIRMCEIELWNTKDITTDVKNIATNSRRELTFKRFTSQGLSITLNNYNRKFSPSLPSGKWETGFYNDELTTDMPIRVYAGNSAYTCLGHYYINYWKINAKDKIALIDANDYIIKLTNKDVSLPATILSNKTVEYLLEYVGLIGGIPTSMMDITDTSITIPYYFPIDQKCWDELKALAESIVDNVLYLSNTGRLVFKYFAANLPHERTYDGHDDFSETGYVFTNIADHKNTDKLDLVADFIRDTQTEFEAGTYTPTELKVKDIGDGTENGQITMPYQIFNNTADDYIEVTNGHTLYFSEGMYLPIAGDIRKIGFYVQGSHVAHGAATLTIEIWSVDANYKPTSVLATSSAVNIADGILGWRYASFNQSINVDGKFAIVAKIVSSSTGSPYPNLQYWSTALGGFWQNKTYYNWDGTGWSNTSNTALTFRIYIDEETPMYETGAYYISPEYDTGVPSIGVPVFDAFSISEYASDIAANAPQTFLTYEIGTYDTTGTAWADIPAGQKESLINGQTPSITPRRYIKWRARFYISNQSDLDYIGLSPIIYKITQRYSLTGTYVSPQIDTDTSTSYTGLAVTDTLYTGNTISIESRSSADGITWDSYLALGADNTILSTVRKYLQFRFTFARSGFTIIQCPQISSFTLFYLIGSGDSRFNTGIKEIEIEDLEQTISNEFSGENAIYNKVTIKSTPYTLQSVADVWVLEQSTTYAAGQSENYIVTFDNPCLNNATMRLYITITGVGEIEFPAGTSTASNLTVTFAKHPTEPTIELTAVTILEITKIRLSASAYLKTGAIVSINEDLESQSIYGLKEYIYDNDYVTTKSMADAIAVQLLRLSAYPVTYISSPEIIKFDDNIKINDIVRVEESETGLDTTFEVMGLIHRIDIDDLNFMKKTELQLREIDTSIYFTTGYWGMGKYWGSEGGLPQYWGGDFYGS